MRASIVKKTHTSIVAKVKNCKFCFELLVSIALFVEYGFSFIFKSEKKKKWLGEKKFSNNNEVIYIANYIASCHTNIRCDNESAFDNWSSETCQRGNTTMWYYCRYLAFRIYLSSVASRKRTKCCNIHVSRKREYLIVRILISSVWNVKRTINAILRLLNIIAQQRIIECSNNAPIEAARRVVGIEFCWK